MIDTLKTSFAAVVEIAAGKSTLPTDQSKAAIAALRNQFDLAAARWNALAKAALDNAIADVTRIADEDTWISPKDAARILGLGRQAVYDLCGPNEPFLVTRQPLPRKILVSLKSVHTFRWATVCESFWQPAGLKARNTLLAANRATLCWTR